MRDKFTDFAKQSGADVRSHNFLAKYNQVIFAVDPP
jgi:hypothetical protein